MGFRKSDYGVYNACKQCGTISCHKHMISQAPTQKSTYKYDYNDKDKVGCRGLSKVKDTIFQFEDKKKTEKNVHIGPLFHFILNVRLSKLAVMACFKVVLFSPSQTRIIKEITYLM